MANGIAAPIDFEARFDKAMKNLEDFMGKMDKRVKKGTDAMSNLEKAGKLIAGAFTFNKILDGLQSMAEKASEAEESSLKLALALKATGDDTQNNIGLFKKLAKELEKTSKYDDDLILSQVAVAKQFGVTNKEAEKLIRVAVDLSAITGEDLTTSVRNLGQTLDGTAGKMANQFPILQQLTAAQLRNGAAIKVLGDQYRGAAAQGVRTFAGQTNQLNKAFGNLQEALGTLLITNPKFLQNIADLTAIIVRLTVAVERGAGKWSAFWDAVSSYTNLKIFEVVGAMITITERLTRSMEDGSKYVDVFGGKMDNLAKRFNPVTGKFEALAGSAKNAARTLDGVGESWNSVTGKFSKGFDESKTKFDRFANETVKQFEELEKQLKDIGKTELDTLTNLYNTNRQLIEKAVKKGYRSRTEAQDLLGKLELKYIRESHELRKKQYAELEQKIKEAFDNPAQYAVDAFRGSDKYSNRGVLSEGAARGVGAGLGVANGILQGREGARNMLASGIGAIASIWLGPLGGVVGQIVGELSKGKDNLRKMMDEFFDSMPEFMQNIIEAGEEGIIHGFDKFPEMIERFADRLPDIIERIIENMPKIIEAIIKLIPRLVYAFIRLIGKGIGAIWKGLGNFLGQIASGAKRFIGELMKGAGKFISELMKGIKKAGKGIAGAGGESFWSGDEGAIDDSVPIIGGLKAGATIRRQSATQQKASIAQMQPIILQISNKQLASAMVDMGKLGFKI